MQNQGLSGSMCVSWSWMRRKLQSSSYIWPNCVRQGRKRWKAEAESVPASESGARPSPQGCHMSRPPVYHAGCSPTDFSRHKVIKVSPQQAEKNTLGSSNYFAAHRNFDNGQNTDTLSETAAAPRKPSPPFPQLHLETHSGRYHIRKPK